MICCLVWLLALGAVPAARAQLVIEITRGEANATPLAVVPFAADATLGNLLDLAAVVSADLQRSGRFAPLPREDLLSRPTSAAAVDFADWRLLGVDALVVGRVLPVSEAAGGAARGARPSETEAVSSGAVRAAGEQESRSAPGPTSEGQVVVEFEVLDVVRGEELLALRITTGRSQLRTAAHLVADEIYEVLTGTPGAFATRIAYVTQEGRPPSSRYSLVVADADGENAAPIFQSPQPIMSPSWSPAGQRLAFVSFQDDRSAVYVQELATGEQTRVSARQGVNSAPSWSPDGNRLALALSDDRGDLDIHVLDLTTQALRRVTRSRGIDTEPVWADDGRTLYFTSDRAGGPQVYRTDLFSGRTERLTFEGSYNARPRLSPDGRRLALVHEDGGNYRIAVLDLRTRGLQVLTDGRLDESPSFAPNGSMIIYATEEAGVGVLAAVAVDGSVRQRLASPGGDVREPVWGPLPVRR